MVEAKGKKAAERLLETWIAELEAHRTIDPDRLKLAELLDRWLEATRGEMRVASYNSYRRIRRIHVDPALGQVLAGKLTRAQLSTYYAAKMRGSKKKKPLAETTVAHHHAMLKTAYNWALEEELLLVNPALRVKNPPALRPKTRPVWSMGEIASTVIKARGLQVHAAGVLAGFSGLRVGEVAGLLWSDLDLTRGFVTVSRTVEEDDDGTLLEYPPKNGKARTVPLPAAACDELRVWLAAQKEYRLAQGPAWNEAGRVVPKKDGTPDGAFDRSRASGGTGSPARRSTRTCRSTACRDSFGTWVYETYGVKQAQEWLGHSDPATTLRHYVRLTTAARAKAVAGLDEVTRAALEQAETKGGRGRAARARQRRSVGWPPTLTSCRAAARGLASGAADTVASSVRPRWGDHGTVRVKRKKQSGEVRSSQRGSVKDDRVAALLATYDPNAELSPDDAAELGAKIRAIHESNPDGGAFDGLNPMLRRLEEEAGSVRGRHYTEWVPTLDELRSWETTMRLWRSSLSASMQPSAPLASLGWSPRRATRSAPL